MYKVNSKKEDTIKKIKEVLTSNEMLLEFAIFDSGNKTTLIVEKETQKLEYNIYGSINKMEKFLKDLKKALPNHLQRDVDMLIEEIS